MSWKTGNHGTWEASWHSGISLWASFRGSECPERYHSYCTIYTIRVSETMYAWTVSFVFRSKVATCREQKKNSDPIICDREILFHHWHPAQLNVMLTISCSIYFHSFPIVNNLHHLLRSENNIWVWIFRTLGATLYSQQISVSIFRRRRIKFISNIVPAMRRKRN